VEVAKPEDEWAKLLPEENEKPSAHAMFVIDKATRMAGRM
jgi:hypothetical protein